MKRSVMASGHAEPVIETARLVLRRYTPADLDALYEVFADPAARRFYPCAASMRRCETMRDSDLLMAQNGVWQGKQLLPATWVTEATQPDRPQVGHGKLYPGYKLGYQYYWWTFLGEDHAYEGQGIRGQFVIVMVNAWPKYWDDSLEIETYAVFDGVRGRTGH